MANLPTTIKPTITGSSKSVSTNVREIKLGSNYTQRTADGINNVKQRWGLEFLGTIAEIDELDDFFNARGGWDDFGWTPPRQSTVLRWTCKTWDRDGVSATHDTLRATIEQQFDLN